MAVGGWDTITTSLKNQYANKNVEPMVNVHTPFRRKLTTNVVKGYTHTTGGILKYAANLAPPQNIGQIADGDDLPAPVDRSEQQFQLEATLFPGTFQIGWLTKAAGSNPKAAFNKGEYNRRVEETIEDTAKHMERIYCGTHGTGRLGTVEAQGTNTIQLAKPEGVQLFRINMRISERTTDGGDTVEDSLDNRTVTALDEATRTITYSNTNQTSVVNNHIHVVTKLAQTSLSSIHANGLRGLIDDGTFLTSLHGLSRITYPQLKSVVNGNGGTLRDLSEQILMQTVTTVRQRSGKTPTDMWSNTGQSLKYIEFVAPDRRYAQSGGGVTSLTTGYDENTIRHVAPGGSFNLNEAFDIIPREIFFLNSKCMFLYKASGLDWWDGDGQILKPVPTSGGYKAAWFGALCAKENIGVDFPRALAVVRDLKDSLAGD